MTHPILILTCVLAADPGGEIDLDRPAPELLAGRAFTTELEATLPGAVWQRVELRRVLRRLGGDRRIAVLLDRRLDPTQPVGLEINQARVADVLDELARRSGGEVSLVGNVVYIGPQSAAGRIRTLAELRANELRALAAALPRERRAALSERRTAHWSDLAEPGEVLDDIADAAGIRIANPEAVPYDLWAGATLPYASLPEALSLVLVQFDLTFQWLDDGQSIELVPIPEAVDIEKSYSTGDVPAEDAAAAWMRDFENLNARVRDGQVVVRGTIEQHEALARTLSANPGRSTGPETPRQRDTRPTPLKSRTFTIRQRVTAAGLIATLEKSGVEVQYDPAALESAGIDLNSVVELDLKQATAVAFFSAWCEPLGLKFTIDGVTVSLSPR